MAYAKRKRSSSRSRVIKRVRRGRPIRGSRTIRTNMAKLIRNVALRTAETKHVHRCVENLNLYHNLPGITTNILYTSNGTGDEVMDTASSYNTRVGDEIYLKGIDFRFWLSAKSDRPNVQFRVLIFKYKAGATVDTNFIFQNFDIVPATTANNKIIAYADTQNIKVLKQFRVASSAGDYSLESGATNREKSYERKVYLPMSNARIKYATDGTTPRFWDVGVAVVAYDTYGTLFTDNIASYAWSYKMYFKDP